MTCLIILRHGNTFNPGDQLLRVGARTDIPLASSGIQQIKSLGAYFKHTYQKFDAVYCSELKRTQMSARYLLDSMSQSLDLQVSPRFNEIDYGIDDGQPEHLVRQRLGNSLERWEQDAIVPPGWKVDIAQIIYAWKEFAWEISHAYPEKKIMVVTSNGIARFALALLSQQPKYHKLKTAHYGELIYQSSLKQWGLIGWNRDHYG